MTKYRIKTTVDANGNTTYMAQRRWLLVWWDAGWEECTMDSAKAYIDRCVYADNSFKARFVSYIKYP